MNIRETLAAYLLLSAACLSGLFFREGTGTFVLALFLALCASFATELIADKKAAAVVIGLYGVLCFFMMDTVCFLPLIAFAARRKSDTPYVLIIPVSAVLAHRSNLPEKLTVSYMLLLAVLCLLAGFLAYILSKEQTASRQLFVWRDEWAALSLSSEREKQILRERKDAELLSARLSERNRIAREIHDDVGHLLSRAILMNGAIKTVNRDEALAPQIETLEATLNEAMTGIRNSVHDLHDDALDLERSAKKLTDEFSFCPVTLQYKMGDDVPAEIRFCFLQVLKEALVNVMKHSDATHVDVIMTEHPAIYRMSVSDNGHGDADNQSGEGIGLQNMKERVRGLGGTIHVTREEGFRIFLTVPRTADSVKQAE